MLAVGALSVAAVFTPLEIAQAASKKPRLEFRCSKDIVNCLKRAHKACPKNVTFIGDRGSAAGFTVLPRGSALTVATIMKRPAIVFCTPK